MNAEDNSETQRSQEPFQTFGFLIASSEDMAAKARLM
jgi:hypothetical protein